MPIISRRAGLAVSAASLATATFGGKARAADAPIGLKVSHYLPPNHTFQKELTRWGTISTAPPAGASSCESTRLRNSAR